MRSRALRRLLTLEALILLTPTILLAQSPPPAPGPVPASSLVDSLHYNRAAFSSWDALAQINPGGRVIIVTLSQPTSRHACSLDTFTPTELVCKGPFGTKRAYQFSQIAALIVPGELNLKIRIVLALNAALGASIWGTVVLAAACPACAVATGIAALVFFGGAGAILIGDDVPDRLLYLSPGQTLHVKLRY